MSMSSNPWVSKFASPLLGLGLPSAHQAAVGHGGVEERTEHMMGRDVAAAAHQAGLVTVADVESLYAQTDAAMEATNQAIQACTALSADDRTSWQGQYAAWQAIKSDYQSYHSSSLQWLSLGSVYAAYLLKLSWFQDRMTALQQQIPVWQQRIAMACPGYVPPPATAPPPAPGGGGGAGPPGGQPSWICSTFGWGCPKPASSDDSGAAWSTTILVVAVVVGLVAGFWFFSPVVGAYLAGRRLMDRSDGHGSRYGGYDDDFMPRSRRLGP